METSSATSDVECVFKAFAVTKGEMVTDGDDLADVVLAVLALWWLICGEAGVDMHGARRCREEGSTVTMGAGTGGAKEGCMGPPATVVAPMEERP